MLHFLIGFLFLVACHSNPSPSLDSRNLLSSETTLTINNYPPTILPDDTTQLWLSEGDLESDTVLILCQGGPKSYLNFEKEGRTSWRYLPRYSEYQAVHLHQAQTYNPTLFEYKNEFTLENAQWEIDSSLEMLTRAIHYYKKRDKVVVVIGQSYGAFIINQYLINEPFQADRYFLCAIRFAPHPQMVEEHLKGRNTRFEKDGTTLIPFHESDLAKHNPQEKRAYLVKQYLKAILGKSLFLKELADKDLSNVVVVYATNDENVGRMTTAELDFLKSQNARVYSTETGHSETIYRLVDILREGKEQL